MCLQCRCGSAVARGGGWGDWPLPFWVPARRNPRRNCAHVAALRAMAQGEHGDAKLIEIAGRRAAIYNVTDAVALQLLARCAFATSEARGALLGMFERSELHVTKHDVWREV